LYCRNTISEIMPMRPEIDEPLKIAHLAAIRLGLTVIIRMICKRQSGLSHDKDNALQRNF